MVLKELFKPVRIGGKVVKNRIALPPMILCEATPDGYVTPGMLRRYRTIAEGGAGMIIVEGVAVNTPGARGIGGLVATRRGIQGLGKIADEIRLRNAVSVMQILHCGRQALPEANNGVQPVSVSDVPYWHGAGFAPTPRPASLEELETIKKEFVNAALLAQKAGFDGAEIHCAHGYLLATFLSGKANTRIDKYGGGWEERTAYPLEVVKEVRKAVSRDFIVGVRISANYEIEGEPTLQDMIPFAKKLEELGIDYISVSGGTYESHWKQSPPCYINRGSNIAEAAAIKETLNIPVLVAGGICIAEEANSIIAQGKADIVCMGRAIFADPDLPNKIKTNKMDEIRPCIRCNMEFADSFNQHQVRCSVNFQMGREAEYEIRQAPVSKRVMVVGGGPGGLEAARVSALRGHRVELYEKAEAIGGSMIPASAPSHKEEIGRLIKYFARQMELLGVDVNTGVCVNEELIRSKNPDALILSTGAKPLIPPIDAVACAAYILGEDVLLGKVPVKEPAVVVGGGCVGVDVVLELIRQGIPVTLIEQADACGAGLDVISRSAIDKLFSDHVRQGKLTIRTGTILREIWPYNIIVESVDRKVESLPYGSLILALGYVPASERLDPIDKLIDNTYIIGDAVEAGRIRHAIHEGFIAGYSI